MGIALNEWTSNIKKDNPVWVVTKLPFNKRTKSSKKTKTSKNSENSENSENSKPNKNTFGLLEL